MADDPASYWKYDDSNIDPQLSEWIKNPEDDVENSRTPAAGSSSHAEISAREQEELRKHHAQFSNSFENTTSGDADHGIWDPELLNLFPDIAKFGPPLFHGHLAPAELKTNLPEGDVDSNAQPSTLPSGCSEGNRSFQSQSKYQQIVDWQHQTANAQRNDQQQGQSASPSVLNNQQQLHPTFAGLQNRPQSTHPDLAPMGSQYRGGDPSSSADRVPQASSQDQDPRSHIQQYDPGQGAQMADNTALFGVDTNMTDWQNPQFDWTALTFGVSAPEQTPHLQQSPVAPTPSPYFEHPTPQQQQSPTAPAPLPYYVNHNVQPQGSPPSTAIPSNVNPRMLGNNVAAFDRDDSWPPGSFHYQPRETERRPAARGRHRGTAGGSITENPECIDCGKRYRTSGSPGRCSRCGAKYERKIAEPRTYTLDRDVPDLVAAKRLIYPPISARNVQDDDFDRCQPVQHENQYLQLLLDAVNVVQSEADGADEWKARQQKTFNEKAKLEKGYNNNQVTARLRALFWEAVMFHRGGPESVYAVGGDNAGYSENLKFPFSERINIICDVLRSNKRVVMDVVEGRGVQGFVSNPRKYDDRKASNNFCNVKKKKMMDKGKELEDGEESVRATTETRQFSPDNVIPSIETAEAGPSRKRRRAKQASPGSPMADDEHSPDEPDAEYQPPGQAYGSGRSMTADWVHGGRRGRGR